MKDLPEIIGACARLERPAALATLVRVKGSSYRQPGARMLFHPGGAQTGLISAGCLETDVKARIHSVLAERQPQVARYEMGTDLDLVWGTGMGCQGRAEVMLEALDPGPVPAWMSASAELLRRRQPGALATVFAVRGPTSVPVGARFLLGTGEPGLLPEPGPLRDRLLPALTAARDTGQSSNLTLDLDPGQVDLLLEPILAPYALWIFGAGEHAQPLARLAKGLGWWLGVVDHRPALATAERFPEADRIVLGHPPEVLEGLDLDRRSAALVISHIYEHDRQVLTRLLQAPLGYLGLQGNRARSARLIQDIVAATGPLSSDQEQLLHWPAGLDLGAESPEAIALSMLAEVQAVLAGHSGIPLRRRQGGIHAGGDCHFR